MRILEFDTVKSTNQTARTILDMDNIDRPGPIPDVIVSRKQTQGKGRSGNWFSPEDCGIYMSVIKNNFMPKPPCPCCDDADHTPIEQITELIGDTVREVLEGVFYLNLKTYGINDIYLAGRKLAGILCEYHTASNKLIVGIGVNTFRPVKIRKDLTKKIVFLNDYAAEYLIDHTKLIKMIAERVLTI